MNENVSVFEWRFVDGRLEPAPGSPTPPAIRDGAVVYVAVPFSSMVEDPLGEPRPLGVHTIARAGDLLAFRITLRERDHYNFEPYHTVQKEDANPTGKGRAVYIAGTLKRDLVVDLDQPHQNMTKVPVEVPYLDEVVESPNRVLFELLNRIRPDRKSRSGNAFALVFHHDPRDDTWASLDKRRELAREKASETAQARQ